MIEVTTFETRDAAMQAVAEFIAESLENALKARGEACAALSGGTTPAPAYRALAQRADLDWNGITFALVDERFVPPTHDASNERLLEQTLAPAFARGADIKPMYFAAPSAADAAASANALYENLRIDVALMGMGEDGHTASWFPRSPNLPAALDPSTQSAVIAVYAEQAYGTPHRLTLTRAALTRVGQLILLITGVEKRRILEAAVVGPPEAAPVAALFTDARRQPKVFWAP